MEDYLIYSVEDDSDIANIIKRTLAGQGYDVVTYADGESFLYAFNEKKPQMVLLDMMLPGIQGQDVLKQIRSNHDNDNVQIIIISARTLITDKVDGLDLGADDYIEKPFDLTELVSRVNAHARRNKTNDVYEIKGYSLDVKEQTLMKGGKKIQLTPSETKVLSVLFENSGKVVTRKKISVELYGDDSKENSRMIDMYIRAIRKKIGPKNEDIITSVYGSGYKIL
jgi:two-component system alkaline phosphatase synthesis response regulator PhoP